MSRHTGCPSQLLVGLLLHAAASSTRAAKRVLRKMPVYVGTHLTGLGSTPKWLAEQINATSGGRLKGLFIHDHREADRPTTYMAETRYLLSINSLPQLIMEKGDVQTVDNAGRPPILTSVKRYTLDLTPFMKEKNVPRREFRERYLGELFNPDLSGNWDRKNINRLRAEGHNRLAAPLYNFAFAMIAIVSIIGGSFGRRGMAGRITGAMAAVFVVRTIGFAGQSASTSSVALTFLQYLMPIRAVVICSILLSEVKLFSRKSTNRRPDFLASE